MGAGWSYSALREQTGDVNRVQGAYAKRVQLATKKDCPGKEVEGGNERAASRLAMSQASANESRLRKHKTPPAPAV